MAVRGKHLLMGKLERFISHLPHFGKGKNVEPKNQQTRPERQPWIRTYWCPREGSISASDTHPSWAPGAAQGDILCNNCGSRVIVESKPPPAQK